MNLNFGKNIKELRTSRGLSQEKLAEYLRVSPQSVSKWERNEGYPDIMFLIPLAEFFGVSLDVLMGRDEALKEKRIKEILSRLEHYRHIGDHQSKNALARAAYAEFPYDFGVISWYITALMDVENVTQNKEEIESLCAYVMRECTVDRYRYDAVMSLVELYSCSCEYEKAKAQAERLPDLNDSREFALCDIYPADDERNFHVMADFIHRSMEDVLWFLCRIAVHRATLSAADRIRILEQACAIADALYPAFDHGICHSVMADIQLSLFRYYTDAGQTEDALAALQTAFRHQRALDLCANDVITHTSVALRGYTYDMKKTWDGGKCNGVQWLLDRLGEPPFCFACYNENERYQAILAQYRPYALADKTVSEEKML
ncbi:MAG: helix-turn-helix transcriptional regulator [Clostridia bacterium]|nr:helix-turn-helix transcriptional regulator [Clostridia bacterium]